MLGVELQCQVGSAAGAEDRVKANEQLERSKMESEYQAQMHALATELERVREELNNRTNLMGSEMERWRQQAEATSRCATVSACSGWTVMSSDST